MKSYDVTALGELLIDFTENGTSEQGNPILEANPGGAPCNVLAMLNQLGKKTAFIGKVGDDMFGRMLAGEVEKAVRTFQTWCLTSAYIRRWLSCIQSRAATVILAFTETQARI